MPIKTQSAKSKGRVAPNFIDFTGQKFGYLTVIKRGPNSKGGHATWICNCICGKECTRAAGTLKYGVKRGSVSSCGCKKREAQRIRFNKLNQEKIIDLTGVRFGRWTVLKRVELNRLKPGIHTLWNCKCDCGTIREVFSNALRRGDSQSCGCLPREKRQQGAIKRTQCRRGHVLPPSKSKKICNDCVRDNSYRKKYNITLEKYNELLDSQNYRCAICKNKPRKRKLVVDHDHQTGVVRGLLCNRCNTGLGRFRDLLEIVQKAADYLAETQQNEGIV